MTTLVFFVSNKQFIAPLGKLYRGSGIRVSYMLSLLSTQRGFPCLMQRKNRPAVPSSGILDISLKLQYSPERQQLQYVLNLWRITLSTSTVNDALSSFTELGAGVFVRGRVLYSGQSIQVFSTAEAAKASGLVDVLINNGELDPDEASYPAEPVVGVLCEDAPVLLKALLE